MKKHYLIQKAVCIPEYAQIFSSKRYSSNFVLYLTKTFAAPGDDDDSEDLKESWSAWESLFC